MKIILHADDFGFNEETTKATIECFERGALTSATIMVNCEASAMAIEYAQKHPEFSWGVHLTYVDGLSPVCKDCKSLLNNEGTFIDSNVIRKKALLLCLNQKDIVKETIAQIEILTQAGIKVSHLDSHGHIHKFPSFLIALKQAARKCGIERVRGVQNIFVKNENRGFIGVLNNLFKAYITSTYKTTNYFYMAANSFDTNWADNIIHQIDGLGDNKTLEVGVHPGSVEEWRINEFNDINEFAIKLKQMNHVLINWNDIC